MAGLLARATVYRRVARRLARAGWIHTELRTHVGYSLLGGLVAEVCRRHAWSRAPTVDQRRYWRALEVGLGFPSTAALTRWEDAPGRTAAQVIARLTRAAEAAARRRVRAPE